MVDRRITLQRGKNSNTSEEMSADLKSDIQLAFNLFKNERNKVTKLKLRTLLFSFVMYKASAQDINEFIVEQISTKQEEFTYDEVCKLVMFKLKNSQEKEADELFYFVNGYKGDNVVTQKELQKAFEDQQIEVSSKEVNEMVKFMIGGEKDGEKKKSEELIVAREEFKKFYTENK